MVTETATPCAHFWLIEPPTSKTSLGCCRLCGEEREFHNYMEWEEAKGRGRAQRVMADARWQERKSLMQREQEAQDMP